MSAAAHVAKKYMFAIATVYMCYLTHGVQAIILSQNKVNFYTQWGYTDAAAGAAAVSIAITLTGVGKFVSVWIGGEISDRIGRKIPAVAEANPKYAGSSTIGIKAVISVSGIVYPLISAMNSGETWHINIWIPIILSGICVVFAALTPFAYDDKRKEATDDSSGAKNEAEAEIQAAKDAMLQKPTALTNFVTLFFGFVIMFIMYGAQQYTKAFGQNNLGLDEVAAAGLTSIYTVGSIIAVLFWAFMMGKLRWNPIKVILIDGILAALALIVVIAALPLNLGAGTVYFGIAVLGFSAAGGMLQTGVTLRQQMCPGPRGRNVGMYYTFMGFASVFLPFIVGFMTTSVGETQAVWVMMILLLVASLLSVLMSAYVCLQYKRQFGYSAMARMKDEYAE